MPSCISQAYWLYMPDAQVARQVMESHPLSLDRFSNDGSTKPVQAYLPEQHPKRVHICCFAQLSLSQQLWGHVGYGAISPGLDALLKTKISGKAYSSTIGHKNIHHNHNLNIRCYLIACWSIQAVFKRAMCSSNEQSECPRLMCFVVPFYEIVCQYVTRMCFAVTCELPAQTLGYAWLQSHLLQAALNRTPPPLHPNLDKCCPGPPDKHALAGTLEAQAFLRPGCNMTAQRDVVQLLQPLIVCSIHEQHILPDYLSALLTKICQFDRKAPVSCSGSCC